MPQRVVLAPILINTQHGEAMRAAVLNQAPGEMVVSEVSVDRPAPDEVLIRTAACGLCHSDLHVIDATLPIPLPAVLGHEAAGVIEAVGTNVSEFSIGDRVVGCLSAFCGYCDECQLGRTWLCTNRSKLQRSPDAAPRLSRDGVALEQFVGLGAFAEEILVHRSSIVRVPDELPLDVGALLGCAVITGVGTVFNAAKVEPGSSVVVIGTGGIGLNIVQGARIAGASQIIAVDLRQEKLDLARKFGATDTVDASAVDNPVAAVHELTKGGAQYAFESIGLASTARQAYDMVRPGRTAYLVGVPPVGSTIELPGTQMTLQAKGLQGVFMGSNRFKHDIPMLARMYLNGQLILDDLVADRISLDQVNAGYETMRNGSEARSVIVFD